MATQWETDRPLHARDRDHDHLSDARRQAEAREDTKRLVLRFAENLERNWALSAALILAACIVISII